MKSTKYLLGILLTILIGSWLYAKYCCDCKCNKKEEVKVENNTSSTNNLASNEFQLNTEGLNYSTSQNFKFLKNNFNTAVPVSDSINIGIDQLKEFLMSSKKKVNITGYALASEKNNSIYENLGIARASEIKNYLVSKGIDAKRIDVFGEVKDNLILSQDTIIGPQKFDFLDFTEVEKVDYSKLKDEINANPLIMYFKTGESTINLSDDDRKKVTKMLDYLENVEGSKLDVVGHTDNVGKRDVNVKLGLGRAEFATNYLIENGISKNKIISSSKGPDEPIADNNTSAGRDKNRRTVVSLK